MLLRNRTERNVVFQCFILIFLVLNLSSLQDALAQQKYQNRWPKTAESLTVFQPGDAVRITIWDLSTTQQTKWNINFNRNYPIDSEGFVILPLIGEIKVKGLTAFELIQRLEKEYEAYLERPYVYVRPLIRVTMQGAFNSPGSYYIDPASSLWELVRIAGGPTRGCDLNKMWVERGGEVVIKKLLDGFERGESLEEIGIESGDQIIAPQRGGINFMIVIQVINLFASLALLYLRLKRGW